MPKPSWKTPNLMVISRGKPEEKVLLGCKVGSATGPGGGLCDRDPGCAGAGGS